MSNTSVDTEKCLIFGNTQTNVYNEIITSGIIVVFFFMLHIYLYFIIYLYLFIFAHTRFSGGTLPREKKNVLKGNYVDVLQSDLFVRLYNELEHLDKSNFNLNVVKHISDHLDLNPLE